MKRIALLTLFICSAPLSAQQPPNADFLKALDTFRTLVVKSPQNPTYHYHYAMALLQKGDRENAKKECQSALADKPSKTQENEIRQLMAKVG